MGQLIVRTLPLAIGGAVSPVLLIAVVLILSGEHRARQRALAFAVGNVAALAVLTVLVATLFHSVGHTGTGPTTAGSGAHRGGTLRSLALGFALMATNVSTVALYLAALKDVAEARVDAAARLVTIVVVVAVVMVPVVVPLVMTVVAPGPSTRILAGVRSFVTRYRSLITGLFVLVFGAVLLAKGFHGA
jgi:hypothetical protein